MSCCNQNDTRKGHGYYVLPRFVEAAISINRNGKPMIPRNNWFQFHLNGLGQRATSSLGTWDDAGEVYLTRLFPNDSCGNNFPVQFACYTQPADTEVTVKIYGLERLADGKEVEVWRNGQPGWTCNNNNGTNAISVDVNTPAFTKVTRIIKGESADFITLSGAPYKPVGRVLSVQVSGGNTIIAFSDVMTYTPSAGDVIRSRSNNPADPAQVMSVLSVATTQEITVVGTPAINPNDYVYIGLPAISSTTPLVPTDYGDVYGYWYPDELEPKYRMIKLPCSNAQRITVLYRKRGKKITSLLEPIPLRSKMAVETIMRSIKAAETDPAAALVFEELALRYLTDDCLKNTPSTFSIMQMDPQLTSLTQGYIT